MIVGPGLDAGRLAGLVEELGGVRAAAAQFADQFVQMLPQRIARVSAALQGGDRTRIADALQGLRASPTAPIRSAAMGTASIPHS